jgi:hypothetical protein
MPSTCIGESRKNVGEKFRIVKRFHYFRQMSFVCFGIQPVFARTGDGWKYFCEIS